MVTDAFVILMGVGTVFVGLLCIVLILELMHVIISRTTPEKTPASASLPSSPQADGAIENREELVAAVSAALAESIGTDLSAIRIFSFKKLD